MRFFLIIILFLFVGCASTPEQPGQSFDTVDVSEDDTIDDSLVLAQTRAVDRIQARIENEKPPKETVGAKVIHSYELDTKPDHPKVKKWIRYYSKKDRKRFQRFLNRGARYKEVIQDLLVTNGLPADLYYLGILESGYVTKAVSHAGAVGPWQFMAPTGRQYGLKINDYVDERVDPIRSTLAAIRYLKELYRIKRTWYLALAAYNAGPGRVGRAMRRGGVRNYWHLTRRRLLPYDTREYIPQFLAILSIGKDLKKYGFVEKSEDYLQPMELVKVPGAVPLKTIAKVSGYDFEQLKKLNPHLRKKVTPPTKKKVYHLWVHKNSVAQVKQSYDALLAHRIQGLKVRSVARSSRRTRYHRVRRGQNLSTIARRYGTSVSKIKRLNRLRSSRIMVGQRLKVKPRRGRRVASRKPTRIPRSYRVRRGDNLTVIARRYGLSVARLKKINRLRSGRIHEGQRLKLKGLTGVASKKVKRYRIRRGDNLYKIAKKFGMTIRTLKRLNNLRSNNIMRGQYLRIAGN